MHSSFYTCFMHNSHLHGITGSASATTCANAAAVKLHDCLDVIAMSRWKWSWRSQSSPSPPMDNLGTLSDQKNYNASAKGTAEIQCVDITWIQGF